MTTENNNQVTEETRPAILQMSGFTSVDDLEKSMPDIANALNEIEQPKSKRGRKPGTKNKQSVEDNPLMADKRYTDAINRMSAFGASQTIEKAFQFTGAPLDIEEKQQVDDLAYVASKQYNLDPSRSPLLMGIYTIILLARLIMVRIAGTTSANMWESFSGIFGKKESENDDE